MKLLLACLALVAVLAITAGLLAQPPALPPAKQAIEDNYAQERAAAAQDPAPYKPEILDELLPEPPFESGIFDASELDPAYIRGFAATNMWRGTIGDVRIRVVAGAFVADLEQGAVVVIAMPLFPAASSQETVFTPIRTGPARITSMRAESTGPQLDILTEPGISYVFDVPSRSFILPPTSTTTTTTVPPTSSSTTMPPHVNFTPKTRQN